MKGMRWVNPYNFVQLHSDKPDRLAKTDENTYTGRIVYEIKTLSPIFIPNTSEDETFGASRPFLDKDGKERIHKSMDFFSYNDLQIEELQEGEGKHYRDEEIYEPVIPGSEIRGAVRSVYEALTDSCLSFINLNSPLSKRTPEQYNPGVLKMNGDKIELYAVIARKNDYLVRDPDFSVKYYADSSLPKDGREVYFSLSDKPRDSRSKKLVDRIATKSFQGSQIGYLLKGNLKQEKDVLTGIPSINKHCNDNNKKCDSCETLKNENCIIENDKYSKCPKCPGSTRDECVRNNREHCYLAEKHCAHVFSVSQDKPIWSKKKESVISHMNKILDFYDQNSPDGYSEYRESWEKFKIGRQSGIPVYYSEVKGHYYLSPACITREVYYNTLEKCIKEYSPCQSKDCLCPACRLFGMLNKKMTSLSKVRFGDATLVNNDLKSCYFEDNNGLVMLPELSSPKPSATEFYLQKPEDIGRTILNWTYDYYVYLDDDMVPKIEWNTPTISGRKFYWHSLDTFEEEVKKRQTLIEKTDRNRTIRPVKNGVIFKGELYFDRVTEKELEQITALMNISAYEEKDKYGIKLGAGKPHGMGSISLRVIDVFIRNVTATDSVIRISTNNQKREWIDNLDIKELFSDKDVLRILKIKALDNSERTKYPQKINDKGYQWFVENRISYKMDRINKNNPRETIHIGNKDKGPRSRRQVVYKEYMIPLRKHLARNNVFPPQQ